MGNSGGMDKEFFEQMRFLGSEKVHERGQRGTYINKRLKNTENCRKLQKTVEKRRKIIEYSWKFSPPRVYYSAQHFCAKTGT